jgi:sulfoxide reductase heme-binding subunit YedZ
LSGPGLKVLNKIVSARILLWCVLAIPAAVILFGYFSDARTYGEVIHESGEWAVRLLIVTMAITPLRLAIPRARWTQWLAQNRRGFGVATFCYAALHLAVYIARKQELALILEEGTEWDLLTGWLAFAIFLALAVTSNDASLRLLRRLWKKLHRFVYLAALLTFAHWMLTAFDMTSATIYAAILVTIESLRLVLQYRRVRQSPA